MSTAGTLINIHFQLLRLVYEEIQTHFHFSYDRDRLTRETICFGVGLFIVAFETLTFEEFPVDER